MWVDYSCSYQSQIELCDGYGIHNIKIVLLLARLLASRLLYLYGGGENTKKVSWRGDAKTSKAQIDECWIQPLGTRFSPSVHNPFGVETKGLVGPTTKKKAENGSHMHGGIQN